MRKGGKGGWIIALNVINLWDHRERQDTSFKSPKKEIENPIWQRNRQQIQWNTIKSFKSCCFSQTTITKNLSQGPKKLWDLGREWSSRRSLQNSSQNLHKNANHYVRLLIREYQGFCSNYSKPRFCNKKLLSTKLYSVFHKWAYRNIRALHLLESVWVRCKCYPGKLCSPFNHFSLSILAKKENNFPWKITLWRVESIFHLKGRETTFSSYLPLISSHQSSPIQSHFSFLYDISCKEPNKG